MAQTPPKPVRPPFILSPEDVAALSTLVGVNLTSPGELVWRIHDLVSISVEGVSVTLKPGALARLKSRALHAEFKPWLTERIREWANVYVGL